MVALNITGVGPLVKSGTLNFAIHGIGIPAINPGTPSSGPRRINTDSGIINHIGCSAYQWFIHHRSINITRGFVIDEINFSTSHCHHITSTSASSQF